MPIAQDGVRGSNNCFSLRRLVHWAQDKDEGDVTQCLLLPCVHTDPTRGTQMSVPARRAAASRATACSRPCSPAIGLSRISAMTAVFAHTWSKLSRSARENWSSCSTCGGRTVRFSWSSTPCSKRASRRCCAKLRSKTKESDNGVAFLTIGGVS